MAEAPGLIDPMLSEVTGVVQALSEYTPRFMAVIVPLDGTVMFTLIAARVVAVKAIDRVINAIIVRVVCFWDFARMFPPPAVLVSLE